MTDNKSSLRIKLNTLAIFRDLLNDPVIRRLDELLRCLDENAGPAEAASAYSAFVSSLYQNGSDLGRYILKLAVNDENFYIRQYAAGKDIPPVMEACLEAELSTLEEISLLKSDETASLIDYSGFLPSWENTCFDMKKEYRKRLEELPSRGFGIFAKYSTFCIKSGQITPVKYPDRQRLDQLFGYEREREQIIKNTLALIEGRGCNNMLLYGDAGTGKSSTIKAVANEYSDRGLRLVEVKKTQLFQIPDIVEELSASPLKFILYIDDLSFTANDDNFSALKAILEGSVSTSGDNIAIYATSNRRHLVKETMDQRSGDDLHLNDTLQETMSLASRFGLSITFQRPDKDEYLNIVDRLAEIYGIDMDRSQLHVQAESHAIRNSGRSPRVAKQFIELLKSGL